MLDFRTQGTGSVVGGSREATVVGSLYGGYITFKDDREE